jgi:hypothetical protein
MLNNKKKRASGGHPKAPTGGHVGYLVCVEHELVILPEGSQESARSLVPATTVPR